MKVLLDYRMTTWSGIGRYSRSLALALSERSDVRLCLIKMVGESLPDALSDVQAVDATRNPLSSGGFREMREAVIETVPDVVHCTHITTPNLIKALPGGLIPPIVTTMHDVTPLLIKGVMPSFAKRAVYSGLNNRAVNWSRAIVTPSKHSKSDVEKFFPRAKNLDMVTAIPLAANELLSTDPLRPAQMECLAPQYQQKFILSMGNTKPHKDVPSLLLAFELIADEHGDLSLVLVGEEPPGYLKKYLDAEYMNRVIFTGPIGDEQLVWLYQHARTFAFPSQYEGFGLPPLEAMTFGCPTVVADVASLPEVVGDAGIKVPVSDANALADVVERILTDEGYASELEDRGMARAKEFTWAKTAEETVKVYKSVLKDEGDN